MERDVNYQNFQSLAPHFNETKKVIKSFSINASKLLCVERNDLFFFSVHVVSMHASYSFRDKTEQRTFPFTKAT